jgi:dihydrodipicolinate reductase
MRIVLFGATGNVGQRIVREALARGHQITGVVRGAAQSRSPDPRVTLVEGDATDPSSVARVARGESDERKLSSKNSCEVNSDVELAEELPLCDSRESSTRVRRHYPRVKVPWSAQAE